MPRQLLDSEYNLRKRECDEAARLLELDSLRFAQIDRVCGGPKWVDVRLQKRARHVVTENLRARSLLVALRQMDLSAIGGLMADSHASLRDDFEVSVPAVDDLVRLIGSQLRGRGGARMTGGGFGGSVVALMPIGLLAEVRLLVEEEYPRLSGFTPRAMHCQAAAGACLV